MWAIRIVNITCFVFAGVGSVRMLLGIATTAWYHARYEQIHALPTFTCEAFHAIANQPKPWYVRLNDVLERNHV